MGQLQHALTLIFGPLYIGIAGWAYIFMPPPAVFLSVEKQFGKWWVIAAWTGGLCVGACWLIAALNIARFVGGDLNSLPAGVQNTIGVLLLFVWAIVAWAFAGAVRRRAALAKQLGFPDTWPSRKVRS